MKLGLMVFGVFFALASVSVIAFPLGESGSNIRGESGTNLWYGESGSNIFIGESGSNILIGESGTTIRGESGTNLWCGESGSN